MKQNKNVDNIEIVDLPSANQVIDILVENKEAGLIIASSIGTAIIIYVLAKSVTEIIKAFRNSDK
jgi:hypothetical protein